MSAGPVTIRAARPEEAEALVPELAGILIDCVENGASVSFMSPLTVGRAEAFWRGVFAGVQRGDRVLLVAETATGPVGTVQVVFAPQENQPHRADVAKMLVRTCARRQGIGAALMRAAEDAALSAGKTLLVLDTATGETGERLYERMGWTRVGVIPDYALYPDGRLCATTVYYRRVSRDPLEDPP
jgi:GNAT superfamily N-acetyltransferase